MVYLEFAASPLHLGETDSVRGERVFEGRLGRLKSGVFTTLGLEFYTQVLNFSVERSKPLQAVNLCVNPHRLGLLLKTSRTPPRKSKPHHCVRDPIA